jgi:hypothetical protein
MIAEQVERTRKALELREQKEAQAEKTRNNTIVGVSLVIAIAIGYEFDSFALGVAAFSGAFLWKLK